MARLVFDDSEWPLLHLKVPAEFTQQDWDAHLAEAKALQARGDAFAVLNDSRGAQAPSASQRAQIEGVFAKQRHQHQVLGVAVVTDSKLVRTAANALNWMSARKYPFKVFNDTESARAWLRKLLDAVYR